MRDIRLAYEDAVRIQADIMARNPGAIVAGDAAALGGQPPAYYAPASLAVYTTAARPAASVGNEGTLIRVKDASSPEQVQVCVTTSAGAYEWVVVALASS